jgi:hypothetical protein
MGGVMEGLTIVKWVTLQEARNLEENRLGGLGGFFQKGMRWEDYKKEYIEEVHYMLEILRESITKNEIKWTGEDMQDNGYETYPLWSNGKTDSYSWRAWGDLMAAVWSSEENKDYSYMDFYM